MLYKELTHGPAIARTVDHSFWVFAPKSLRDVAAPAYWEMRFKEFGQFLNSNLTPLDRPSVGAEEGGPVIVPVEFAKWLMAIGASPAAVPVTEFRPH